MNIEDSLDARGYVQLGPLLSPSDADTFRSMYADEERFRSHIVMRRHGFGEGEYKYFAYPLPERIAELRRSLYEQLLPVANRWQVEMHTAIQFPDTHDQLIARCHADGQSRPTPLMLKYQKGDFNCLHQDLYGQHVFPLQVVILLSDPSEFDGGEFVLTEQRPRMQSRVEVVTLRQGHGVAFAVNERPKQGSRGFYRVKMRHGVSNVRHGDRYAMGIIFHDAT